jgi:endonuclease YncB( thermonuclease family)
MRSLIALVVLAACASGGQLPAERRQEKRAAQQEIATFEAPGLVIGEFPLASKAVVDGDTIHVVGLNSSLRLLGIDTEETFKHEAERRAYEAGWEKYLKDQRGTSPHPVKMATPFGDEAKHFAERFFAGAATVRLERDHPKEVRDYYDRYLAYVFVQKDGQWLNYNVEAVRAGMAPYFSKYGYSRRFHNEFVTAENEARAARRGIWDPTIQHYPDYEERKKWWDGRAEFIKAFEAEAVDHENYLELTNIDAPARLEAAVGHEVVVLGSISEVKLGDPGPTLVMLGRRRGNDFPLVFFDKDVFAASHAGEHVGEYVRVKGTISRYEGHGRTVLEMKIDVPSQLTVPAGHP